MSGAKKSTATTDQIKTKNAGPHQPGVFHSPRPSLIIASKIPRGRPQAGGGAPRSNNSTAEPPDLTIQWQSPQTH